MTLLHQAAQKAVEAPKPCPHCGGAAICDPWPVGVGAHQRTYYKVLCRQVISCCASGGAFPTESEAIAAWNRRPESALQQQPEPVAWMHTVKQYGDGDTEDLALSFAPDNFPLQGNEAGMFYSVGQPKPLYTAPPALQQQEVPREPVAPTDDEILAVWRQVRLDDASYLGMHMRFARALLALYASPSTTESAEKDDAGGGKETGKSPQQECKACHGKGYTNEGDPEIGNALFTCEACSGSGCVPAGAVPTVPALAVVAAVPRPQVPGELPRHRFWGAGEPDCPPELKAPNGELHTTRCKVCGDGWRKSHNVCLAAREPMPVERIAMLWNSLPLETDPQSVVAFVRAVERFHGIRSLPDPSATPQDQGGER